MGQLVGAKFLLTLPLMLAFALTLGVAAGRLLDLSPALAFGAQLAAATSAVALTGLAVGTGAATPRFGFTNANELAMSPGALTFMAMALGYAAITTLLLARPAWVTIRHGGAGYWGSAEGLLVAGLLGAISLVTTVLPLWWGTSRLARHEE